MRKKPFLLLPGLCLALSLSAQAANYFVVAPVPGKKALLKDISVSLDAYGLPAGIIGSPYQADLRSLLSVTGDPAYSGTGVTWSVAAGVLPAGLALQPNGVISGVPTAAASAEFSVRAAYKTVTGQQAYQVYVANITVGLAGALLPEAQVGQAYSYDLKPLLTVTGDSTYSVSSVAWSVVSGFLPAGLQLQPDGSISGVPTAAGSGPVRVRATYKNFEGEQVYQFLSLNIQVGLATASLPQATVGAAYTYDFKSLLSVTGDPGYAGSGVSWSVVSGSLPAGLNLNAQTGVLTGTPSGAGVSNFSLKAAYRNSDGQAAYALTTIQLTTVGALTADTSADFGAVLNGTTVSRTFTFRSTGTADATGAYAALSGNAQYAITANTCGTLGAPVSVAKTNGSCSITVRLTPAVSGAVPATSLAESWTGYTAGSSSVALTGQVTPAISITIATYGANVGGENGNRTSVVQSACNGKTSCTVDPLAWGDPYHGSGKNFVVRYTCPESKVYSYGSSGVEAGGRGHTLTCP